MATQTPLVTLVLRPKPLPDSQGVTPDPAPETAPTQTPIQDSTLPGLPVELLLIIASNLPLHTEFYLSQTCRRIHWVLHRDWPSTLQKLTRCERMEFWAGCAYILPDYFACTRCCKLHAIDLKDTPKHVKHAHRSCPVRHIACHVVRPGFILTQRHVHLALKYHRLGNVHSQYLRDLMAYHSDEYGRPPSLGDTNPHRYWGKSHHRMKIVSGRFLFASYWTFSVPSSFTNAEFNLPLPSPESLERLCWHHFLRTALAAARELQTTLIRGSNETGTDMLGGEGRVRRFSCGRCRTDIAVQLTEGKWSFWAWRDLGTETGTGYPKYNNEYDAWLRWGQVHADHLSPPEVPHVPGSIERLFFEGVEGGWKEFRRLP